jgi:hypothetical protein
MGSSAGAPELPASAANASRLKTELTLGYALQVVSLGLLMAQHLLLPIYLGLAKYGLVSLVVGSAGLLHSAYDHGFNLLTVRKPAQRRHYLAFKYALFAILAAVFVTVALVTRNPEPAIAVAAVVYGAAFVIYTQWSYHQVALGNLRLVVRMAVVQGILTVSMPILLDASGLSVVYAPPVAMVASLLVTAIVGRGASGRALARASAELIRMPIAPGHIARAFVKQAQISLGTILDGMVVGFGVLLVVRYAGLEAGGAFRVVMSLVALLTLVIPMPKHVLLKNARKTRSTRWGWRYAAGIVGVGALQVIGIRLLGRFVIGQVAPGAVEAVYAGIVVLAPVAALKALFELETILHDVRNRLSRLPPTILVATPVAGLALALTNVYGAILTFYITLTAAAAVTLMWRGANISRPSAPWSP